MDIFGEMISFFLSILARPRSFLSQLHKLFDFENTTQIDHLRSITISTQQLYLNHPLTTTMKDFITRTACLMALATSSSHITSAHPVLRGSERPDEKQRPFRLLKKDTIPNPIPIPTCDEGMCVNALGGCDTIVYCFMDPCDAPDVDCKKKETCQADYCGGCNYVCV